MDDFAIYMHDYVSTIYTKTRNVGKVSTRFDFFLSGFAILLGLFLKLLGLGAEFHSASNGGIFNRGHRTKNTTCAQNTGFPREFSRYLLFRLAILLGLFLKSIGLDAEFNSALNGAIFSRGH